MSLPLLLFRTFYEGWKNTTRINISRISPSDDWSTIDLVLPKEINAGECDFSCSGNGLLCFYRLTDGEFVIWNLSTDTCQSIPHSELTYLPCACSSARCVKEIVRAGSGLGLVAGGFKFVRFMCIFNQTDVSRLHNSSCHVAVYSSKNNSWKEEVPFPFSFDDELDVSPRGDIEAATCVNGFLYWTTSVDAILSFELSSDSFSTLPFPDDIGRYFSPYNASLLELDGSLGLGIQFELKKNTLLFSFWVYGGGSGSGSPWTKKLNLDVVCDASVIRPLWLGKKSNGEYSLLALGYHGPELDLKYHDHARKEGLLEYDYSTREVKKIDLTDDDHPHRNKMIISSSPYVEAETNINIGSAVDRISPLPDDIILSILSLLSLKEAAASTSLLSKRWSDLWRHTPNLNFHFAHHLLSRDKHKYIECVNSVVGSYRAPALKELNVSFPLNYATRRKVTKWLEFAFSRRVEVLELNFLGRVSALVDKLLCAFKSTNLRSLCLKCLQVGGDAIGLVLRNCPMLERLIIKYAVFTSDVEVCGGALKHLDIHYCKGGVSIKCYAPNLTHLKIDSGPLMVIYVPPVLDYPKLVWAHPFISSQLTTLEFTDKGYLEGGFPEMPSLRVLIVTYHKRIRPITCLLRAVPYLEEFEIKHCRSITEEEQQQQKGMEMEGVKNICWLHGHLRVFKFTWFDVCNGDHMKLMSYILENCVALHKIILDIYDVDSPRTSPACAGAMEYVKLLQSKLPTHIQFIVTFNYRQLLV